MLRITAIGLIAGAAGTGGGGFISYCLLRKPGAPLLSSVLGFSAGVMLSIVFMDLLPESIQIANYWYGIAGLLAGIGVLLLLDMLFPHYHHYSEEQSRFRFRKVGTLLGIGIALHNVPEGLAIGAGYASSAALGAGITLVMIVQNIPEGMAMATAMCMGGLDGRRVVYLSALAGVPMGIGALLGAVAGSVSPHLLSLSLSFAGGAMLYITCDELIPDAHELSKGHSATLG
ncbi:MAG TPA: ZIP family metal transporter, partial [Firmicutes bacterium]|nr:ZIP family metal transporter [Bacillota bacterium]